MHGEDTGCREDSRCAQDMVWVWAKHPEGACTKRRRAVAKTPGARGAHTNGCKTGCRRSRRRDAGKTGATHGHGRSMGAAERQRCKQGAEETETQARRAQDPVTEIQDDRACTRPVQAQEETRHEHGEDIGEENVHDRGTADEESVAEGARGEE